MLLTIVRILVLIVCSTSILIMTTGFIRYHDLWNQKTRDYWYGRMLWSVVGVSASIEGITRQTPFRYTIVFLIAAALATLKGNLQKGSWGSDRDKR